MATVAGAAIPSPYGGKFRQVQIDLDQRKLQAYGLSAQDVVNAVGQQNIVTPVGTEKVGDFEYVISLNGSPDRLVDLNDLPVRVVNGATIFIRDVAYAHDGSPPQINMVRVDGSNAVLMTILKAGSSSTLDVINGVKALLPKLRETLPASLNLKAVGDQSSFVNSAVNSVILEGVIAAALTGLMILVFLGSWRSTLIITISIPLAILASIAALSAIGETINVMTLGGLALAVGILVDDATVTIENINWHLEQDKDIESAIMDGARQIVIPATVSLLCICVVFVPMFNLGGVAGFLFRPMAEAVVFALVASYVLSRTLVSTMARYFLAEQGTKDYHNAAPTRNPLLLFQRGFERGFAKTREAYRRLLEAALGARRVFIVGFLAAVACSFALTPFLGQNFFPPVEGSQIKLHLRAPTGTRIEETARLCDRVERAIRATIPGDALGPIVDNIGLPLSGINSAYNNSGTVGPGDADILITLNPGHGGDSDAYVRALRETLPRLFPGASFAFLPADIVSQILNFGLPSPIDVQIIGPDQNKDRVYADALLKRIARVNGVADARIQQAFNNPTLNVKVDRVQAGLIGLSEGDVAKSLQNSLSGSFKLAPDVLDQSEEWRRVSDRRANPAILAEFGFQSGEYPGLARGCVTNSRRGRQVQPYGESVGRFALRGPARHRRLRDQQPARLGRGVRRYPPDYRRDGERRAAGIDDRLARPDRDDDLRLFATLHRPGAGDRADLPAHRRQFSILARSFCHYQRLADRAGGHRVDALHNPHNAVRSRTHRRNHVHGRGDRQQHSGGELRTRKARRWRRRARCGARRRSHALSTCPDDGAGDDHRHGADGAQRRAERAARPRRDRRPDLLDCRDAVFRARRVPPCPRAKVRQTGELLVNPSHPRESDMSGPTSDPNDEGAPARPPMKIGRYIVLFVLIALGVATTGIASRRSDASKLARWTYERAIPNVAVVAPTRGGGVRELVLPGDVEAFYNATVHAQVSGYVKQWTKDIGAHVKAGDVLATIDTPELDERLAQAGDELAKAKANQALAAVTAQRWNSLRASAAVSQQAADEKVSDAAAKDAEVAAATSNVQRLKALKAFANIVAPFDGVVTQRNVDIGTLVGPGTSAGSDLFAVADTHEMRVYVKVPQTYAAQLREGMKAALKLPEYPDRAFDATVVTTSHAIDKKSRSLLVELQAKNEDGALQPGAFAQVRFQIPEAADALKLPASAMIFRDQSTEVATVGPDNQVVMKKVEIDRDFGSEVAIGSGLSASDRVIANPLELD